MRWFPPHVPVGARRARVARVSDELRRNGVDVQPVHIEGRSIARSFWGRRWCHHLESCSDFENRLPRGRAYVRNGSVCHLDVHAGGVDAMVVGSDLYHVVVRIRKLEQVAWKAIRAECAGRVGSVIELLQGRLSDHVLRVVTDPDRGLFPKPGEITLTCDCPDWAVMCKHAAAVLYGVGSRLDNRPELLFRLRDVDAEDLVVGDMALPDAAAGDDVLAGDLADIFGIDLDPADSGAAAARQSIGRRRPRRGRPRRTGAPPAGFQPTAPGGGATPPGRILGPRVRGLLRDPVDGVPLGSGPRAASEPVRRTAGAVPPRNVASSRAAPPGRILGPRVRRPAPRIRVDGVPLGSGPRAARPPSRSGGRITSSWAIKCTVGGLYRVNHSPALPTPDLSDPARSWPERVADAPSTPAC